MRARIKLFYLILFASILLIGYTTEISPMLSSAEPSFLGELWNSVGLHIFNSNPGNVGIGTQTPTAKLDVEGDVKIGGDLEVVGTLGDRVAEAVLPVDVPYSSSSGEVTLLTLPVTTYGAIIILGRLVVRTSVSGSTTQDFLVRLYRDDILVDEARLQTADNFEGAPVMAMAVDSPPPGNHIYTLRAMTTSDGLQTRARANYTKLILLDI